MIKTIEYVKARLAERSTWASISGGVIGAAALASPYLYVVIGLAVIGAIVPTGGKS